jgi:putative membrane protein
MDACSGMMGMGPGFMWFWAAFSVVVLGLIVAGVIWLARTLTATIGPGRRPGDQSGGARGELDARYARGELTREEYLQRRADIEGHTPPSEAGR